MRGHPRVAVSGGKKGRESSNLLTFTSNREKGEEQHQTIDRSSKKGRKTNFPCKRHSFCGGRKKIRGRRGLQCGGCQCERIKF